MNKEECKCRFPMTYKEGTDTDTGELVQFALCNNCGKDWIKIGDGKFQEVAYE